MGDLIRSGCIKNFARSLRLVSLLFLKRFISFVLLTAKKTIECFMH